MSPPFEIKARLELEAGESPAVPLFLCGRCSSSIDAAWDLIGRGEMPVWGAVLAESQTSGRGRMGRVWQSPPGHVYGALRLPVEPPFDGPGASLALALILAGVFRDFGWEMRIKWPNDLIHNGGKVGGLLLESRKEGLTAGIGFNLMAPPEGDWRREREPGAPLPSALPFSGEPAELWAALVKRLILLYKEKFQGLSMAELVPEAEKILFWRGLSVTVIKPASDPPAPDGGLVGRLTGLGPQGELLLVNADGQYALWSGTVCLRD